jgi:hypothetical protein
MLAFAKAVSAQHVSGTFTQCNLPTTVITTYEGYTYTFSVECRTNNQVVLKVINAVLGIDENNLIKLSLYPNPSKGQFTIDMGKEYSNITVQVYNMLGEAISTSFYDSASKVHQEINSEAGIYFVKVNTDFNESKILRIIKQ